MFVSEPKAVRIYDFLLGGKDNLQVDRDAAFKLTEIIPEIARTARANRFFMERVIHHVVGQAGIRQIIDIGMGLPTWDNVHDIAQRIDPETRVVYVDNDPTIVLHGVALANNDNVAAVESDLRIPRNMIVHPNLLRLIDFDKPVAVLMLASLHYVSDAEYPQAMLELWRETMQPGSYLAISHGTADGLQPDTASAVQDVYKAASAPLVPRTHAQVESFFKGFELVEPGVVDINLWPVPAVGYSSTDRVLMYGGLGWRNHKSGTAG